MKQWKSIIIFGAILILLAGVLIGYNIFANNEEETPSASPTPFVEKLIEVKAQDVSYVSLENTEGVLEFEQKTIQVDDEDVTSWILKNPKDIMFNLSFLQNIMPFYLDLPASAIISDNLDNLDEYGLDSPSSTLTIYLKDGAEITVYFGDDTTGKDYRYAYLSGNDKVYTVRSEISLAANLTLLDILDQKVFDSLRVEDLNEVRFGRSTDNFSFTAKTNNDANIDTDTPPTWQIVTPINIRAHYEGFQKFLNELVSIQPLEFIERNPSNLEDYGLDNPKYAYTLIADNKEIRVLIGGNAGDFKLYAYTDHSNSIFTVSEMLLNHIDKPATELADRFVHSVSIWDVNELTVNLDGENDIFSTIIDDQTKQAPSDFTINGQDANVVTKTDSSYFRSYYQSVISVKVAGFDANANPEFNPEIIIEYKMNNSQEDMLLEFSRRDEVHYYVFKNGVYSGIYVNQADFFSSEESRGSITFEYEKLLHAMANQRDGVYN